MSGKHVFYRIFAELGNVFQAGEFAVRGRWTRYILRIVDFPIGFRGLRATVSGNGQIYGQQGIPITGLLFPQGFPAKLDNSFREAGFPLKDMFMLPDT